MSYSQELQNCNKRHSRTSIYQHQQLQPHKNTYQVLVIRGNSGELYPDHDITDRLCIITPTTTNWNPTSVFVEVGNRANHQATLLDKSWRDRVDSGAIVNKGWDRFTINQSLTNIFQSQPPVSGVLIPVGTGSITGSLSFVPEPEELWGCGLPSLWCPRSGLTSSSPLAGPFFRAPSSEPISERVSVASYSHTMGGPVHHICSTFQKKLRPHQLSSSLQCGKTYLAAHHHSLTHSQLPTVSQTDSRPVHQGHSPRGLGSFHNHAGHSSSCHNSPHS